MPMKAIVTGGSGFIASHLEDRLIDKGWEVHALDFSEQTSNISHLMDEKKFTFTRMDLTDREQLAEISKGYDFIFHLAANSDIRTGGEDPNVDFRNTFLTTHSVLEAMRVNGIKNLFFSSTSAIYGDMPGVNLKEDTGALSPISYYGAFKLASEAAISSYSYMNSFNSLIFRFPNVVGPRLTHGVIFDFIKKLEADPTRLEILGNGKQNKQYVHVHDLADGIASFSERIDTGMNVYNISTHGSTTVREIADMVCEGMGLTGVKYEFTGGDGGWKGDVPSFQYDISKAKEKGWTYKYDSTESVRKAVSDVMSDKFV